MFNVCDLCYWRIKFKIKVTGLLPLPPEKWQSILKWYQWPINNLKWIVLRATWECDVLIAQLMLMSQCRKLLTLTLGTGLCFSCQSSGFVSTIKLISRKPGVGNLCPIKGHFNTLLRAILNYWTHTVINCCNFMVNLQQCLAVFHYLRSSCNLLKSWTIDF